MKNSLLIQLAILASFVKNCDRKMVENYVPNKLVVYTQELEKTEKCVDDLLHTRDSFKKIIFQVAHSWDTEIITENMLEALHAYKDARTSCTDIDFTDLLEYLEKFVNKEGKICLEGIKRFSILI